MSLGLIGKYGSDSNSSISDSDNDGGDNYKDEENVCSTTQTKRDAEELLVCSDPLSLGHGEDSDDSDDSNSETNAVSPSPSEGICTPLPLPLPDMDRVVAKNPSYSTSGLPTSRSVSKDSGQTGEGEEENSVFFNPFKKAEEERLAILKHHVQEFDKKPLVKEDKGHRGARRGHRGSYQSAVPPPRTFAKYNPHQHPQDKTHHFGGQMGKTGGQMQRNPHSSGGSWEGTPHHSGVRLIGGDSVCEETTENELFGEDDSSALVQKPRKHRSGVTDSLVPPKKFMRSHEMVQAKERPWTLK